MYVDLRLRPTRGDLLRIAANANSELEAPSPRKHPVAEDDADSVDGGGAASAIDGDEEDAGEEEAMADDAHESTPGRDDERAAGNLVAQMKDAEGHGQHSSKTSDGD